MDIIFFLGTFQRPSTVIRYTIRHWTVGVVVSGPALPKRTKYPPRN